MVLSSLLLLQLLPSLCGASADEAELKKKK